MSGRAAGRGRGRGDRRRSTEPPTPGRGLGRGVSALISQKPGGSPIMQQTGVDVDQRSGVTSGKLIFAGRGLYRKICCPKTGVVIQFTLMHMANFFCVYNL